MPTVGLFTINRLVNIGVCCLSALYCTVTLAAQSSSAIYQYTDENGVISFSDRAPKQQNYQQVYFDCYACDPNLQVDWQTTPLFTDKYKSTILTQAVLNGVEPSLVFAVIHAESHFNAQAISKVGAQGLMQIMPETGKSLGLQQPFEPTQNITIGTQYLAKLLNKYRGNITLACAAYNAGMSNVDKYNGVPPFKETQVYIQRIKILQKRYQLALKT